MLRVPLPLVLVLVSTAWLTHAGEPLKPGKLTKEEQAALQPGLTLRLYHPDSPDKPLDARRVRLAALHVGEGTAPSPFVDPGRFTAKLSGYLKTALKGEFTFQIATVGSARLRINGKEVLKVENHTMATPEPIQLAKGYNRIEVDHVSSARGAS